MVDDKFNKLGNLSDKQKDDLDRISDFTKRFTTGAPGENITGAEAAVTYKAVASKLSPAQLEEATEDALGQLPETERQEVGDWIRQSGGESFANVGNDPRSLANASLQLTSGGGSSGVDGLLGSLLGGGAQGGGAAGMLDNPLVKGVLASVAGIAMQKFLGSGGQSSGGGGLGGLLSGLLGGGGSKNDAAQTGGGIEDILGGLLGGGGSGGSGGGLDDLLGGLLGGSSGGSGGTGGGMDDLLGGLLGGASGGDSKQPADLGGLFGGGSNAPSKKNIL